MSYLRQHTHISAVLAELQSRYEGQVIALVVQELAVVAPRAGERTVMELVADVWRQAEEHLAKAGRTTWDHLTWFADHVISTRVTDAQMAGW